MGTYSSLLESLILIGDGIWWRHGALLLLAWLAWTVVTVSIVATITEAQVTEMIFWVIHFD